MIEEDALFDYDDNIVITKDKVILQKKKQLQTNAQKIKFNDLDGSWAIEVVEEGYAESETLIDDDTVYAIYIDMLYKSKINNILTDLSLGELSEYLSDCKKMKETHDQSWEKYEEYKLYGMKNPSVKEWSSHFMLDLHFLYNMYHHMYGIKLGKPDEFIKFCFDNSDRTRLPLF